MAAFNFKLQALYSLKRQLEDQAKNKLGAAVAELARENEKLLRIHRSIEMTIEEFRVLSGGVFVAGSIKAYNSFISVMKDKARIQQKVVEEAEEAVTAARRELLIAAQQREMFDKLYEKAYEQHLTDEKHKEQLSTDELISYRGNPVG